jgi:Flp pilus assembly protein TadD
MTHMLRAEYDAALDLFARASGAMPQDARYRANMAVALGMLGRYDESLALYQQVVPAAEAHHNLGVLAKARRDMVRAARELKKAETLAAANAKKS